MRIIEFSQTVRSVLVVTCDEKICLGKVTTARCDTQAPLGNLYRQAARVGYLDRTRQFQVLDQRFGPNTACYREL